MTLREYAASSSCRSSLSNEYNEPFDPPPVVITDIVYAQNDDYSDSCSSPDSVSDYNHDKDTGRMMINQYVIDREIGKGRHGVVKVCHVNSDPSRKLAMKIVDRDPPHAQKQRKFKQNRPDYIPMVDKIHTVENKIRKEIAIMKKCRHPHVVRLIEVIDDRQKSSIYMIMEFLEGGEISWKDEKERPILSVDQSRRIIRDAILGLEYLHHHGIIHRDIKPANLVWSKYREHVKIADFGVAHFSYAQRLAAAPQDPRPEDILLNDSELAQRAGTPPFLAPEVVYEYTEGHDPSRTSRPCITKAIDIWALGVTLYCFLFGRLPFRPPPDAEGPSFGHEAMTYRMICNNDWEALPAMGYDEIPTGGRYPVNEDSQGGMVMHLLDHCLMKDSQLRITLREIKRSRWFIQDLPNPDVWLRETGPQLIQVTPSETSAAMSRVRWRWGGIVWDLFRNVRSLRSQRILDRNPLATQTSVSSSPTHQRSFSQLESAIPSTSSNRRKGKSKRFDETASWPRPKPKSHPSNATGRRSQAVSPKSTTPLRNHSYSGGFWKKFRRKPPSESDAEAINSAQQPPSPPETGAPASDINFWRGRRSIEVLSVNHRVRSTKSDLSVRFGRTPNGHPPESHLNAHRGDIVDESRSPSFESRGHISLADSWDENGEATDSNEHLSFSPKKRR